MSFSRRFNFNLQAASCVFLDFNTLPTNLFGLVRARSASLRSAESPLSIRWPCIKLVQKCHNAPPKTIQILGNEQVAKKTQT
jgi:hypothetical protein